MNYKDIQSQSDTFLSIIKQNNDLIDILEYIEKMNLPNYYIAAGSIFQTIWNYYDSKPLTYGIKDIDIIYYDRNNLTKESEKEIENNLIDFFKTRNFKYECDVHNEARMHLWKKENENVDIDQYENSEDAIDQWIATVHSIGITMINKEIKVYAPYGLSDIFSKTIRPIHRKGNTKELYENKVKKWQERFDNLKIVNWDI